jgi:hypothetical protein
VNFLPPRHFGRRGDRKFGFRVERELVQKNSNFLWSPWRPGNEF